MRGDMPAAVQRGMRDRTDEPSTGLQHACELRDRRRVVQDVHEDVVGDDRIEAPAPEEGHRGDGGMMVLDAEGFPRLAGEGNLVKAPRVLDRDRPGTPI